MFLSLHRGVPYAGRGEMSVVHHLSYGVDDAIALHGLTDLYFGVFLHLLFKGGACDKIFR